MKKTFLFKSYEDFDKYSEMNENWAIDNDNRFFIIKGTKKINGKKFNGVEIFATIYGMKREATVKKALVKVAAEYGIDISMDELESNINAYSESGFVVEIEECYDGCWNISYMCFQDEIEEINKSETLENDVKSDNTVPTANENGLKISSKRKEMLLSAGVKVCTSYTDYSEKTVNLTASEIAYFNETVELVRNVTGYKGVIELAEIIDERGRDVQGCFMCDNGEIFIDTLNLSMWYQFKGHNLGSSFIETVCHEIAHNRYKNHCKGHRELTAHLVNMVQVYQERR